MKMADRAHVNLPNRKPPWWSTAEYGVPMNYGQTAPRPTPGGRKLLTVDEVSGNQETALVKHAPGTVDLVKKAKKEQMMLEEERRIDPNRIDELEKQLRNEVARHTPYHERKHTILVRAFQTFDHDKKGTLPLDAFRRALQCFNVEVGSTHTNGRARTHKGTCRAAPPTTTPRAQRTHNPSTLALLTPAHALACACPGDAGGGARHLSQIRSGRPAATAVSGLRACPLHDQVAPARLDECALHEHARQEWLAQGRALHRLCEQGAESN